MLGDTSVGKELVLPEQRPELEPQDLQLFKRWHGDASPKEAETSRSLGLTVQPALPSQGAPGNERPSFKNQHGPACGE